MKRMIRSEVSKLREYESHVLALETFLAHQHDDQALERLEQYRKKIATIGSWLDLINEDERYCIRRHLIEGVDWPRIEIEHMEKWGSNAKCKRTLRNYQDIGIEKIARFVVENKEMFTEMLTPKQL